MSIRRISAFALLATIAISAPIGLARADENSFPRIEGSDVANQRTVYAPGTRFSMGGNVVGGGDTRFSSSLQDRPTFLYSGTPQVQTGMATRENPFKPGESSNG